MCSWGVYPELTEGREPPRPANYKSNIKFHLVIYFPIDYYKI